MKTLLVILVLTITASGLKADKTRRETLGDRVPFCFFPRIFKSSLQVANKQIELKRYEGTWYEQSAFPKWFSKGCICTTANYKISEGGAGLDVHNKCILEDGKSKSANLKAYPRNANITKMAVYNFIFGGPYWILDIGDEPNYGHVMVGDPCRDSLWILSREKRIDEGLYDRLVKKADELGFDTSLLVKDRIDDCYFNGKIDSEFLSPDL